MINSALRKKTTRSKKTNKADKVHPVEKIVDFDPSTEMYLDKWKRYATKFNTWEPLGHLEKVMNLVDEYRASHNLASLPYDPDTNVGAANDNITLNQ